jgi:hypothetical protein
MKLRSYVESNVSTSYQITHCIDGHNISKTMDVLSVQCYHHQSIILVLLLLFVLALLLLATSSTTTTTTIIIIKLSSNESCLEDLILNVAKQITPTKFSRTPSLLLI